MNENKGNCALCGIEATQYCSGCKFVKYCCAEHQKQHWKLHKHECRPFSISLCKDIGRFLHATRDINAKTIILIETPLIVGPKWYLSEHECNSIVPCVGCFTPVRLGVNSCPRCHWPTCSSTCPGLDNPKLHALECIVLMLGTGPPQTNEIKHLAEYYRIDALLVLKCLMLQSKYPKKWIEFMNLQSHEVEREGTDFYNEVEKRIVNYLIENYLNRLKSVEAQSCKIILPKTDAKIIHKICGIIETNCICINLPNGIELSGLYSTASLLEHSCIPNCYFIFDFSNGFKISVIAAKDIKKGDHLQIMYTNMLWGTHLRQEHLQLTKHFICKCDRCQDPTELGTFLSGLNCVGIESGVCDGIQLPEHPLEQNTDWICNKCPARISNDEVHFLICQIGEEVDNLLAKQPTIEQLENSAEKLSQLLYKNHYHLFNIKHSLIQLYGSQSGYHLDQLSDKLIQKKLTMCNELLEICDKLDPYTIRLPLYVGIILYEKQSALIELSKRMLNNTNSDDAKSIAGANCTEARNCLLRAVEILKKELDTACGAKLTDKVINATLNLDNFIISNSL